jgi:hypothetical protein
VYLPQFSSTSDAWEGGRRESSNSPNSTPSNNGGRGGKYAGEAKGSNNKVIIKKSELHKRNKDYPSLHLGRVTRPDKGRRNK